MDAREASVYERNHHRNPLLIRAKRVKAALRGGKPHGGLKKRSGVKSVLSRNIGY